MTDYIENSIIRRAAKRHRCKKCGGSIEPGQQYVEYVGETACFQSGARFCLACAETELRAD
jgi:hypothetical protein